MIMGKTKKILGHTVTLLKMGTHINTMIDGKLYAVYPDAFGTKEIFNDVRNYIQNKESQIKNGQI